MSSYGYGLRSINGGHSRFGAGTYPLSQNVPAPFISEYVLPIPGVVIVPADKGVTKTEYVTEHVYSTHPNQQQHAADPLNFDNGKGMPLLSEQVLPNKVNQFVTTVHTEPTSGYSRRPSGFPTGMFQRRAGAGRNWQSEREETPPPVRPYDKPMTRPSNDKGANAEYTKESARSSEEIDHKESQIRRQGNAPPTGVERTDGLRTIDHLEAAAKYKGAALADEKITKKRVLV